MRIENEIKLDYKDVLLRPKRSTLSSRKEVSLERTYTFQHSQHTRTGVPIMMSNMDTVGTIEMTKVFYEFGMLGCLHKFYTVEEIHAIADEPFFANTIVSTGILDHDLEKLDQIVKYCPNLRFVCMDVANGYTQRFIDTVALVRQRYPHLTIIAGNVVTQEITEELILKGADIVKVGI